MSHHNPSSGQSSPTAPHGREKQADQRRRQAIDEREQALDDALDDSFPASDPVSLAISPHPPAKSDT